MRLPAVKDESGDADRRDEQQQEHKSYDQSCFAVSFSTIIVASICDTVTRDNRNSLLARS